jgi:ribosomal protein S18 acetylase RimI-like enzyme
VDILSDLTPRALGNAVEENLSALWPSWAPCEGVTYEKSPRWRRIVSTVPHPAFNHLYGLVFDDEQPGHVLEEALAPFRKERLPCFCWLEPPTAHRHRPLFESAGLEPLFSAPGMAALLDEGALSSDGPAGLAVEDVASEQELAAWCAIVSGASGFSAAAAEAWELLHRCIPFGPGSARRHFLGIRNGEPVGTSSLFFAGGVAGLYSVTVARQHRRRGVGTALSTAALETARREGFLAAVLASTVDGAGIYRRLGFREYRRWDCFLLKGA